MLVKLVLRLSACLLMATASGCYWFCPWPAWECGAGAGAYHPGFASPVYNSPSYGQCVAPPGCPECATGIYSVSADPVTRARANRLERMRRREMTARTPRYRSPRVHQQRPPRMPRQPRGRRMDPMYGIYGDYGYGGYGYGYDFGYDDYALDGFAYDPYFEDYSLMGYEDGYGGYADDEFALMSHSAMPQGRWMPSSGCSTCGDTVSSGMVMTADGGWTATSSDCPTCGPSTIMSSPATPQPAPAPAAAPALQPVPQPSAAAPTAVPMSATMDDFYMPRPMPAPMPSPGPSIESASAGSPLQPVLWVPQGL